MCGIAGIVSLGEPLEASLIIKMNQSQKHRGPDDEGYLGLDLRNKNIYNLYSPESQVKEGFDISAFNKQLNLFLGHRRLSIIDLSANGHQPMSYDSARLWITYNGEIFNYRELKAELKAGGYGFRSETDTEVILAAYAKWGNDCVRHFNGDWAFAIYDKKKNVLILSRDRFSIKPLYYFYSPGLKVFAFASEIKALCCLPYVNSDINEEKCFEFLVFALSEHSNQTMYKDIYQIEPGFNLVLDLNTLGISHHKYYYLEYEPSLGVYKHKKALAYADAIRNLLIDSVRLRLKADVPVGTCLSGGLDSSSITVIINKILKEGGLGLGQIGERQKTFTSSFPDEAIDESGFAKLIIEQTNSESHFIYPTLEGVSGKIKDLTLLQDEPFAGTSVYAQWEVFQEASRHVKVALDGQGGDEIFGGYAECRSAYLAQLILRFSMIRFFSELLGTVKMHRSIRGLSVSLKGLPVYLAPNALKLLIYRIRKRSLIDNALKKVETAKANMPFKYIFSFTPNLNNVLYSYQLIYSLPHLLHYEDRNSMACSIESRTPFTDYRLVDYLFSIPACYKYHNGWAKWLLRLAMRDLLPAEILWRKDKIGFAVSNRMKEYTRDKIFDIWRGLNKCRGSVTG